MNFKIDINNDGSASMSWDQSDDISTNVWLSLNIEQGQQFNNKKFGLKTSDINKINDFNVNLLRKRIENAISWLVSVGKATSATYIVERDKYDTSRINYQIEITQADGIPITVNNFITVGGPSGGFTIS